MTQETMTMVVNHVYSQILMRQDDANAFGEWLKAGNFDEEAEIAEVKCRKGESFSFSSFAMEAWNKFNS